jgi:hypothetical protein
MQRFSPFGCTVLRVKELIFSITYLHFLPPPKK